MHYEVELALLIGKAVKDLKADDMAGALDAIKGKQLEVNLDRREHFTDTT